MNLTESIIPKSDQLNADDLISGPRTITITDVKAGSAEQPVSVHYEGGDGRPYKPSKSMRRMLVSMWGPDSTAYIGQSLTLFREDSITFGKDQVGGIRISHATGITAPFTLAMTVKRGRREPYRIEPLKIEPAQAQPPEDLDLFMEVGAKRAAEGMDALKNWYAGLAPDMKKAVKPTLDSEWKVIAEKVGDSVEPKTGGAS